MDKTSRMIPLGSDTESRPTAAMREAIARAEVGDEQHGKDPTVNRLQESERGVSMGQVRGEIRAVTHLGVSSDDVTAAIAAVADMARKT